MLALERATSCGFRAGALTPLRQRIENLAKLISEVHGAIAGEARGAGSSSLAPCVWAAGQYTESLATMQKDLNQEVLIVQSNSQYKILEVGDTVKCRPSGRLGAIIEVDRLELPYKVKFDDNHEEDWFPESDVVLQKEARRSRYVNTDAIRRDLAHALDSVQTSLTARVHIGLHVQVGVLLVAVLCGYALGSSRSLPGSLEIRRAAPAAGARQGGREEGPAAEQAGGGWSPPARSDHVGSDDMEVGTGRQGLQVGRRSPWHRPRSILEQLAKKTHTKPKKTQGMDVRAIPRVGGGWHGRARERGRCGGHTAEEHWSFSGGGRRHSQLGNPYQERLTSLEGNREA
ncbi:unnamed protein product [Prorocentrum cordatum]|uniref:Uncharacterized protein n=1 Tax=Prorocentrum cordatum TaxID=2364126 RepID=A0ABN9UG94_9DINO|nr:unnamed protein product [Polarella glacialis]